MQVLRSLLWIDCCAGLLAGTLMLSLAGWLSALYGLPVNLLIVIGVANLAYGTFSFSLARRRARPRALLLLLVVANAAWAAFCGVTAVLVAATASNFGLAQLIGESLFVGGLAGLEWHHRELLLEAT